MTGPTTGFRERDAESSDGRQLSLWLVPGLVALLLLGYGAYRLTLRVLINNELAALESRGYPTTLQELNDWYTTPPEDQNAARVYMEAFQKLPAPIRERGKFMPFVGDEPPPPTDWRPDGPSEEHIRMYLAEHSEGLELLHEASRLRRSRYPIDLGEGRDLSTPHLSELRRMARVLELDAIMHAIDHRPDAATRSIMDALAAARSLEDEPLLLSQTVRMDCQAIAVDALQRALSLGPLRTQDLDRLDRALSRAQQNAGESLKRGFVGQLCFAEVGRGAEDRSGGTGEISVPRFLYNFGGLHDWDRLRYLEHAGQAIAACEKPGGPDPEAARAGERREEDLSGFDRRLTGRASAITLTLYRQVGRSVQMDAARTAMAVERYRMDRGGLPEKLSEIVPEYVDKVPSDPYDEGRLRYARRAEGYVIYSVGRDRADGGGKSGARNMNPDITFAVLR